MNFDLVNEVKIVDKYQDVVVSVEILGNNCYSIVSEGSYH